MSGLHGATRPFLIFRFALRYLMSTVAIKTVERCALKRKVLRRTDYCRWVTPPVTRGASHVLDLFLYFAFWYT